MWPRAPTVSFSRLREKAGMRVFFLFPTRPGRLKMSTSYPPTKSNIRRFNSVAAVVG